MWKLKLLGFLTSMGALGGVMLWFLLLLLEAARESVGAYGDDDDECDEVCEKK